MNRCIIDFIYDLTERICNYNEVCSEDCFLYANGECWREVLQNEILPIMLLKEN